LPIPPILLKQMGWSQGDDIELVVGADGNLYLKRANK
jgi:antitoxin component of MazEF toxin-antitoxin module